MMRSASCFWLPGRTDPWQCRSLLLSLGQGYVLHDRDFLFQDDFDPALHAADVKVLKTPCRSPNLNAHCERVIRTVRDEVLNHLIISGLSRLQSVLDKWKHFFRHCRPTRA